MYVYFNIINNIITCSLLTCNLLHLLSGQQCISLFYHFSIYQYLFFQINLRTVSVIYCYITNQPKLSGHFTCSESVGQIVKQSWLGSIILTEVIWWYLPVSQSGLKGPGRLHSRIRQLQRVSLGSWNHLDAHPSPYGLRAIQCSIVQLDFFHGDLGLCKQVFKTRS